MQRFRVEPDGFGGVNEIRDANGDYLMYYEVIEEIRKLIDTYDLLISQKEKEIKP